MEVLPASLQSLLLRPSFEGRPISSATGFVVEFDGVPFLVINWHVVTGRHAQTGETLSKHGAVPDSLEIWHHVAGRLGTWIPVHEPLYGVAGEPLWLEHPRHGRRVDVVALPLAHLNEVSLEPYDPWRSDGSFALSPADALSIIGFPFGLTVSGTRLGIWIQGTVATEPVADFEDLPCFLVDSRTVPGSQGRR